MKTKPKNSIYRFILAVVLLFFSFQLKSVAQDYQISFAETGSGVALDSVMVANLTQCTFLNLKGDDILNLSATVGIREWKTDAEHCVTIYPNPMQGACVLNFDATTPGKTTIELFTITGKRILQMQEMLTEGPHSYRMNGIGNGIFLLKIESGSYHYTAKINSTSSLAAKPEIKPAGNTPLADKNNASANKEKNDGMKSSGSVIDMQYNAGDLLMFKGKSGTYKALFMLVPAQSQTVTFNFIPCTDADSNHYAVVQIGTKLWTAENLKTTKYGDGTSIDNVTDNTSWTTHTTGAYCDFDNHPENGLTFGKLYNFYAVADPRNIAPAGWHVATDAEWTALTDSLGGWETSGGKLRETCTGIWLSAPAITTNETGFSALPGGIRDPNNGTFTGQEGYYWTSTPYGICQGNRTCSWGRLLYYYSNNVYSGRYYYNTGFSVRCVKD